MSDAAEHVRRARAEQLLGGPDLARLRARLRQRFRRVHAPDEMTLGALDAPERRALERLLGKPPSDARSMRVRISEIDATLRAAGIAPDLRSALELLDGALEAGAGERRMRDAAWAAVVDSLQDEALARLLSDPLERGLWKRLAGGDPQRARVLLDEAHRVLARLPAAGVPISRLAAETLGDSHALDPGRPVATLVLRACARARDAVAVAAVPDTASGLSAGANQGGGIDARVDARVDALARELRDVERARDQWARVGVSVNELARPVLVLALRTAPGSSSLANAGAERGEPVHLSLRSLLRDSHDWRVRARTVYVCENPTIVALAADELAASSPPLVCTDGMPGAAQRTLLAQLARAGAQLAYHGDFDWPGLAVGNFVRREFGARPWRFGAADYLAACAAVAARSPVEPALRLVGERVEASWDPQLAAAMSSRGLAVHEEAIAASLLDELRADAERRSDPSSRR